MHFETVMENMGQGVDQPYVSPTFFPFLPISWLVSKGWRETELRQSIWSIIHGIEMKKEIVHRRKHY